MIVFERRVAWLFRAAVKRCFDSPASRGDQTPVQMRLSNDGLLMHASTPEIVVMYGQSGPVGRGVFTFPVSHFSEFEGKNAENVEIVLLQPNLAGARWTEKGRPREMEISLVEPESIAKAPELPKRFMPLPKHFPTALHDASCAAANVPTKYAITRVQLRGKAGTIVGTDTRQLLVAGGYAFPFTEDLLIPRSGIFGLPFQAADEVGIGRTDTHLFVRVGPWMFGFFVDTQGRYPPASSIIPRSSSSNTHFKLNPGDAQRFLDSLIKKIKGPAANEIAVTLDLLDTPCLRFEMDGRVTEVNLVNSEVTGKRLRMCMRLSQFLRALELRFQEFEIVDANKPIVARDGDRLFMAMPLSPDSALPSRPDRAPAPAQEETQSKALAPIEKPAAAPIVVPASAPMALVEKPAATAIVVPASAPMALVEKPAAMPIVVPVAASMAPTETRLFDLLSDAEGLRDGLIKVADHAGRILRFLREVCTQPNVLQFARNSLQVLADRPLIGDKST